MWILSGHAVIRRIVVVIDLSEQGQLLLILKLGLKIHRGDWIEIC